MLVLLSPGERVAYFVSFAGGDAEKLKGPALTSIRTRKAPLDSPLKDIRICDLSQNLAGPFCCQILGDLGAEVIKVEPPGGDPAREWGPPFWGSDSTLFLSVSRNKRSIVLDLKSDGGKAALKKLAATCDVFVQSTRPGVPERHGYDYDSIRALRSNVIYLSVSGYGEQGPMRGAPGYDPLIQAFAGIMSVTGDPEGTPARVGGSVVDYGTGMWGAMAVLAALRKRELTGEGAKLEVSLLDTALNWVSYHLTGYLSTGQVPAPMGTGLAAIVPYQAFPAADGMIMIAAGNDGIYRRLCTALDLEELGGDSRFATNPQRVAHREVLVPIIEEATRRFPLAELSRMLTEHGVPASPIHNMAEVAAHPQVAASEMLVRAPHREVDDYQDVSLPIRVDGKRIHGEKRPPGAGEHTAEVLAELGYTAEEIERDFGSG